MTTSTIDDLRVITLYEPLATLVMLGVKPWETRSWPTKWRGPLAIHAAMGQPTWAAEYDLDPDVRLYAHQLYGSKHIGAWGDFNFGQNWGKILGVVDLSTCKEFNDIWPAKPFEFGDCTPGRFGWRLEWPTWNHRPINYRGAQRLWRVHDQAIRDELLSLANGDRHRSGYITVHGGRGVGIPSDDHEGLLRIPSV